MSSDKLISVEQFENGDIDPEYFDHEAHVHVAWQYATRFKPADALKKFDSALRRLVRRFGDDQKYHATLTWFFMLLIIERARRQETWQQFARRNPDLFDSKALLARYYSHEHLYSEAARQHFLLPDRVAA